MYRPLISPARRPTPFFDKVRRFPRAFVLGHRRDSGNSGDSERKPSTRPAPPKYTRSTRAGNDRPKPYEIGDGCDVKKTSSCMTSRLVRKWTSL